MGHHHEPWHAARGRNFLLEILATRSFPGLVKVTSGVKRPQAPQKASRHSKEASGSAGTRRYPDVTFTNSGKFREGKIFCPKMWRRGASQGSRR